MGAGGALFDPANVQGGRSEVHLIPPKVRQLARSQAIPKRPPNADLRTREYLTEAEVERLLRAARSNRWAQRDATMILVAYRQ
jgi:type 1 fimbriae regulatory protein FimB/type 1 fimbriae regulatory protein FimE